MWVATKAVLRRKFIPLSAYINKSERTRINELGMQIKKLGSEQIENSQMETKLEILKIKEEINKIEYKSTIELINKTRSWYFEKTHEIDKVLVNVIKKGKKT